MMAPEVINWDEASPAERKLLHRYVLVLKKRLQIDWIETFQQAFGARDNVGTGYEDNLRKGRVSPQKAYKLFNWLLKNDPVLASNVENDILAARSEIRPQQCLSWDAMMAQGEYSDVSLFKPEATLGMAQFARREAARGLKLKLLEEFYFEIELPFDGVMIAFRNYKSAWFPQLITEGSNILDVSQGNLVIPTNEGGIPDPLWEETETGKHGFAFLLTQEFDIGDRGPWLTTQKHGIPAEMRDQFARSVTDKSGKNWKLFRINLLFAQP